MNPVHTSTKRAALRALAGAAVSACLVATIGLVSSSAAEPPKPAPASEDASTMHGMHEAMGERWAQHVQAHLDKLAERMEIKASQEAVWQKFSAAFRNTMSLHATMGHGAGAYGGHEPAGADAAAMARQQADRAWDHAQKLTQLADATAALQQALTPEQRLVFDEAARHFAREHGGHGGMGSMVDGGHHGAMEEHCEREAHGQSHGEYAYPHGHGDDDADPHGSMMQSPHDAHGAQGEAAH